MSGLLTDQQARQRIATALDETLFVQAGAGSGKTKSLVDRVIALIGAGVEMRAIAAITFTEKAAAELRDRIRRALEQRVGDGDPADRARWQAALEQVDAAAISTLHAFAQRILTEHAIEAALPPNVDVLDEVASQIEFDERWARFRDELLDDERLERCLLLAFAAGVGLGDVRLVARAFQDGWDLLDDARVPWAEVEPPDLAVGGFVQRLEALLRRRAECRDGDDSLLRYLDDELQPYLARLGDAPDEYEALRLLQEPKPTFKAGNRGRAGSWGDKRSVVAEVGALGEVRRAIVDDIALSCVRRIAAEVARFTRDAAADRRASGRLEFHDLLVLARDLLRGPHGVDVRARLRDRYQRLLLDEFQDTDPIQIELAVLIASQDPDAAGRHWSEAAVQPGRLFFVGDPKQSIYRFRRADIDLYLRASAAFGNPPVSLTTNFRTTPPVIAWVNHVFGDLIRHQQGAQPAYEGLAAAPARTTPPDGHDVVVLGEDPHPAELTADEVREREAADVADAVLAAQSWQVSDRDADGRDTWRGARLGDVAILLPARTSLAALERELDRREIPYRAETSSLVYSTREVRDLLMAVRAVADPSDSLALVAALRSAVFGCGDDDLVVYKVAHAGRWSLHAEAPDGLAADHPVVAGIRYLGALHRELPWLAPAEVLGRIAADRRLFELGYASGRPRDLWRRLRFVIDQARAWSEAEGGTLREYLGWARLQASESARVAETVLPETDDDAVRILTIHGAKGLEFPVTIVSGMTSQARGRNARVDVKFPADGPVAIKVGASLVTPEFEAFQPIDEQMDFCERLRLLYVACTRAQDHLVVSLHRKARPKPPAGRDKMTNAELIADAGAGAPHQQPLAAVDAEPLPAPAAEHVEELLDVDDWRRQRAQALETSTVRQTIGASDIELVAADEVDDDIAAGVAKSPRDLDLPPWQKGRYGSAIGRAVHAVLQTIDLATGRGLDEAAAAQAAAEGVVGREEDIAHLAAAALQAPAVAEAVRWPRWRETYVATPVGGRTLEGYIDLLYRTDDGLVVVDYKTASASADLDERVERYRAQGGAYALAVEQATGEAVARVVFVFLTAAGAVERELPDVEAAKAAVLAAAG